MKILPILAAAAVVAAGMSVAPASAAPHHGWHKVCNWQGHGHWRHKVCRRERW
jgi:hypothetical protein